MTTTTPAPSSAWTPFRHQVFAVLWTATVVSNIGTWMHDVGAGWLMTSLSPSPLMVALVQTATTLPIFLFALPAGALADVVDRRRLLISFQLVMAALAALLAVLVSLDMANTVVLLLITFLLGTCAAFIAPAWQAIVPRLVPKDNLQQAIAINSVGINISRAIGPALAGFVIVALGAAAPFALNAASFIGVIAALLWWRPAAVPAPALPAEALWEGVVVGLRYARSSRPLKATLLRAAVFFLPASSFWALLPLIARKELAGSATLYGVMLASVGAGAVGGALLMPAIRRLLGAERLVIGATVLIAVVLLLASTVREAAVLTLACLAFGAGWIAVLSTLNVSAQIALPDWVRARGLSVYLTAFFGAMSAGSALWGQVAAAFSIPVALLAAAGLLILAVPLTRHAQLHQAEGLDLSPSMHWPAPIVVGEVAGERSPVMTTIEYRVQPGKKDEFLARMAELSHARRRSGAYAWGVLEDAAQPGCFVEYFLESSWLQHLRHHERVSGADRVLQQRIHALLVPGTTPAPRHLVGQESEG